MRKTTIILGLAFLTCLGAYGQTINGSMAGRVVDQSQAAVVNATVTVADSSKGVFGATKTGASGDFSVAGLLPGNYTVTVEATGFKKLSRSNIPLDANDKLALGDIILEVGALSESVEVTVEADLVHAESAERS